MFNREESLLPDRSLSEREKGKGENLRHCLNLLGWFSHLRVRTGSFMSEEKEEEGEKNGFFSFYLPFMKDYPHDEAKRLRSYISI